MPLRHRDDSFAAMLLTCQLSPDREELARPLQSQELHRLIAACADAGLDGIGSLIGMDVSGIARALSLEEADAYRLCVLLGRVMPLSYMLERLTEKGVEVVTPFNAEYPERVKLQLGEYAPGVVYVCGDLELLREQSIATLGVGGVKLGNAFKDELRDFAGRAVKLGYAITSGCELGVMRIAEDAALEAGGKLQLVLGGDMMSVCYGDRIAEYIAARRAIVMSLTHPESLFTVSHAAQRMKLIFALSDAAFILNTDNKRGESECVRGKFCKWVYSMEPTLASRGATSIKSLADFPIEQAAKNWLLSKSVQLSVFDCL